MGVGFHHPEVMPFFPNPTLQPKTFPWALVPSSGSKAERRRVKSSVLGWFLGTHEDLASKIEAFPQSSECETVQVQGPKKNFDDV